MALRASGHQSRVEVERNGAGLLEPGEQAAEFCEWNRKGDLETPPGGEKQGSKLGTWGEQNKAGALGAGMCPKAARKLWWAARWS